MEIPTYGGLRKVQKYCEAAGFPMLFVYDGQNHPIDLNALQSNWLDGISNCQLISEDGRRVFHFKTTIADMPNIPRIDFTSGEMNVRTRVNSYTSLEIFVFDPHGSGASFLRWSSEHREQIENISHWGKPKQSFGDLLLYTFRPRTYIKRVFLT